MVNYGNGKIYRIISNETEIIYIGSTTQPLTKRMAHHKTLMKCSSAEILQYPDADIILIENYSCNSKEELKSREQYHIDDYRANGFNVINKNRAIGLDRDRLKNRQKEYREKNKEIIKEQMKEYYHGNKGQFHKRSKEWKEKNKEKIKEYYKDYHQKNRQERIEYAREVRFMNNKKRVNEVCNFITMINQY